ncbi:serine/threonine-protein kinase [Salinibacter altiplanensis]|uniref:serine/threonine-protein kinase n=1 Tax=Salinibacter altiplanensis TaxID=1803181 RepID=UPI000C9FA1F1|nr:serine/threonine-protein kinase [Salinibacter altiplanensis]
MPDIGDVLDGYRLDAVIGRGGMGTVYRATDVALEKTVALKVIAPHLAGDDTFVRRFREEAKALARLDADGIVDVYALRETKGALFFVMEHVEGPSLQTVLQRRGPLEPAQALSLLRQVLAAVGHAHTSGVLHRDLKPSNILVNADGQAVITDFGLAKILASDADLTATHDQLGTVAYMSPEQVKGLENVNEASDLFAMGLVAYEAFTGQLPFDRSESDFVIQRAITEASFPPPSAYAPAIPPGVEQVVLSLLSKDPADRPPDARMALHRLPDPETDKAVPIVEPGSPASDALLSVSQWIGLAATFAIILGGTYAGVRATLGLPIFSVSPPAPSDTARETVAAGPAPQQDAASQSSERADTDTARGQEPDTAPIEGDSKDNQQPTSEASETTPIDSTSTDPDPRDSQPTARVTEQPTAEPTSSDDKPTESQPPAQGMLFVRSDPEGASVRVRGAQVGSTPVTLDDLEPGSYELALRLQNYRPIETTITVQERDTTVVTRDLSSRPAVVQLRVVPSGKIRIDGTLRPADSDEPLVDSLSPGAHRIEVSSALGRWETQLQVEAGERYEQTVDFTQRVEVAVTARTSAGPPLPNATVQVDSETVGYTPQRITRRVGQHTIRVEKEGHAPVERTVQFEPGMETPLVFELSPRSE